MIVNRPNVVLMRCEISRSDASWETGKVHGEEQLDLLLLYLGDSVQ